MEINFDNWSNIAMPMYRWLIRMYPGQPQKTDFGAIRTYEKSNREILSYEKIVMLFCIVKNA